MEIHCSHTELKDPGGLIPHPKNPNTHPQAQIELLARIIKHQGWRNPIVVSQRSGFIIAGHARLKAAQLLELDKVPVDYQDFETEADEWAHLAADNKLAELAEPDQAILAELLQDLKAEGFDTILAGFDEISLADILEEEQPDQVEVDADPKIEEAQQLAEKWNVKKGQVWQLGDHKIVCGDATDPSIAKLFGKIDGTRFCFTSPPYNAGSSAKLSGNMATSKRANLYVDFNDAQNPDEWKSMVDASLKNMISFCDCAVYNVQMLAGNKLAFIDWISQWSSHIVDIAIWNKGHAAPHVCENVLASTFEFLMIFSPKKNPSKSIPTANCRAVQNVFNLPPQHDNEFASVHGATFPIDLPIWVISNLTKSRYIVDPFLGTGTTLMACESLGRKCLGVELSPQYIAVTIQRWADATGGEPKLVKGNG